MKKVALKRNLSILSKRRLKNNQKPNEKARKELTTQNGQIKRRRKRKEADHRKKERKKVKQGQEKKRNRKKKKEKKKKSLQHEVFPGGHPSKY